MKINSNDIEWQKVYLDKPQDTQIKFEYMEAPKREQGWATKTMNYMAIAWGNLLKGIAFIGNGVAVVISELSRIVTIRIGFFNRVDMFLFNKVKEVEAENLKLKIELAETKEDIEYASEAIRKLVHAGNEIYDENRKRSWTNEESINQFGWRKVMQTINEEFELGMSDPRASYPFREDLKDKIADELNECPNAKVETFAFKPMPINPKKVARKTAKKKAAKRKR